MGGCKLWVDLPYADETFSSFLDRAASFYLLKRQHLIGQVSPQLHYKYCEDNDHYPHIEICTDVFAAAGKSVDEYERNKYTNPEYAIDHRYRSAYCPLCFVDDLQEERSPYFRKQWARAFYTFCEVHASPLLDWEWSRPYYRRFPHSWVAQPNIKHLFDCDFIERDISIVQSAVDEMLKPSCVLNFLYEQQISSDFIYEGIRSPGSSQSHDARKFIERVVLLSQREDKDTPAIASNFCPRIKNQILFDCEEGKRYQRVLSKSLKPFLTSPRLAWRRTVIFMALRIMVNWPHDVSLVSGGLIPRGYGMSVWDEIIQPLVSERSTEEHS